MVLPGMTDNIPEVAAMGEDSEMDVQCLKAKMNAISSDTHQLQFIKLHHFKLEIFKSIC